MASVKKLLLVTTALVGFAYAQPAEAAPLGAWAAGAIFGLTAGTAAFAIVSSVVAFGASMLVSMAIQRLAGQPKQQDVRTELRKPTSLPAYRYVYGETRAPGTPVAMKVKGREVYVCYLLNSRPSQGGITIYFDEREVETWGNMRDLSGPGATGQNGVFGPGSFGPHVWLWFGAGDQTKCPDVFVNETDGYFRTSDAWQGRTVLWAKLRFGSDDDARERWPNGVPELDVDGHWSLVRDPRAGGARNWTRNLGLILLDALRENPMQPYADSYLRRDTFEWLADVSDQLVGTRDGGTIPRYQADGILWFREGQELEDILQPIADAGAAQFTRIGGRLGVIPAIARSSVYTVRDFTDRRMPTFRRHRPSDDIFTEVVATYTDKDRSFEPAETPVYAAPGAQAADGGLPKRLSVNLDWITDHRQAQRVAKIMLLRSRAQREIDLELMPDAFDLVSGSAVTVDLGSPFGSWDGQYVVRSIRPAAGLVDEDSITVRLPATLAEDGAAIYAWQTTDEQSSATGPGIPEIGRVQPPPAVSIISGTAAADSSGDTVIPGVTAAWAASPSASASAYEWEWRRRPAGGTWNAWRSGGLLDESAADGVGVYAATIQFPRIGDDYQIRVKTRGAWGASNWRNSSSITASSPADTISTPPRPTATPVNASRIDVTAAQSGDSTARALLIYGNDIDSPTTATLLWTVNAGASVSVTRSETGLSSGTTRHYFTRARDQWGNLSDFSEGRSATTP